MAKQQDSFHTRFFRPNNTDTAWSRRTRQAPEMRMAGSGGQLTLLPDDGAVTIKGKERFISHVRGGGSS